MEDIIQVDHITKSFNVKSQVVQVLHDITFSVKKEDFLVIIGPSGSGKSTLLHTLIGLEPPSTGTVKLFSSDFYSGTSEDDRSRFRKYHLGMVYQQPNWIKSYTVMDNLTFPLLLIGEPKETLVRKASEALERVGMLPWAFYIPTELSSGQQQKVALARALIANPELIIADEPTGNLDYKSGEELMLILKDLCTKGKTVVMVTHDLEYIKYANTAIYLRDGKILEHYDNEAIQKLSSKLVAKRGLTDLILNY